MSNLKFTQRMILTLYRKFYNENYLPDVNGNTEIHVKAQKMCYLLKHAGVNAGNYNYIWDSYGPYSEGLQSELILLDYNGSEVESFYSKEFDESILFANTDVEGSLLSVRDKKRINDVVSMLQIFEHKDDQRRWVELLGSLAYLANCVMPEVDYPDLEQELLTRKENYGFQSSEIQEAWKLLNGSEIIYNKAS